MLTRPCAPPTPTLLGAFAPGQPIKRECAGPSEIPEHTGGDRRHLYVNGWCIDCHCEKPVTR